MPSYANMLFGFLFRRIFTIVSCPRLQAQCRAVSPISSLAVDNIGSIIRKYSTWNISFLLRAWKNGF